MTTLTMRDGSQQALPLKVRTGIRDHIDASDCPLRRALKELRDEFGQAAQFDPEWGTLYTALQPAYPDPATFAPSMAGIVIAFCNAMVAVVNREDAEQVLEKVLESMATVRQMTLKLEVDSSASQRPIAKFRPREGSFVLLVSVEQVPPVPTMTAGFTGDLLNLNAPKPQVAPSAGLVHETASTEGFVDVAAPSSVPEYLPDLDAIERPEVLLTKPPYYMTVRQYGSQITVQASHQDSLCLLADYLKRWVRTNPGYTDKPSVVKLKLHESAFGIGLMYDTLTVDAVSVERVTPFVILAFVKRILGYELIPSSAGETVSWSFQRAQKFL